MATITQTMTIEKVGEEDERKKRPRMDRMVSHPLPTPPPPPPPYSLTEVDFTKPFIIGELVTCKCEKLHRPKETSTSIVQVSFPRESTYDSPLVCFQENKMELVLSLVPCWHYRFYSDWSIELFALCVARSLKQQRSFSNSGGHIGRLTLAERFLETNSPATFLDICKEAKVPMENWGPCLGRRFPSFDIQDLLPLLESCSSQENRHLIISLSQQGRLNRRGYQITCANLVALLKHGEKISRREKKELVNLLSAPPYILVDRENMASLNPFWNAPADRKKMMTVQVNNLTLCFHLEDKQWAEVILLKTRFLVRRMEDKMEILGIDLKQEQLPQPQTSPLLLTESNFGRHTENGSVDTLCRACSSNAQQGCFTCPQFHPYFCAECAFEWMEEESQKKEPSGCAVCRVASDYVMVRFAR